MKKFFLDQTFPLWLAIVDLLRGSLFLLYPASSCVCPPSLSDTVYYYWYAALYLLTWSGLAYLYSNKLTEDKKYIVAYWACLVMTPLAWKEIILDEIILKNNTIYDPSDLFSVLVTLSLAWYRFYPASFHKYTLNLLRWKTKSGNKG